MFISQIRSMLSYNVSQIQNMLRSSSSSSQSYQLLPTYLFTQTFDYIFLENNSNNNLLNSNIVHQFLQYLCILLIAVYF